MDRTVIEHDVIGLVLFVLFTWAFGMPFASATMVFLVFFTRELTQAEYRWIEMFGDGKRVNMPWWGPFDRRVWAHKGSFRDFIDPTVVAFAAAIALYVYDLVGSSSFKFSFEFLSH